jgi:hypothetical protein
MPERHNASRVMLVSSGKSNQRAGVHQPPPYSFFRALVFACAIFPEACKMAGIGAEIFRGTPFAAGLVKITVQVTSPCVSQIHLI